MYVYSYITRVIYEISATHINSATLAESLINYVHYKYKLSKVKIL